MDKREAVLAYRKYEELVAEKLKRLGFLTLAAYKFSGEHGNEAPLYEGAERKTIAPDLTVTGHGKTRLVEVKYKSAASYTYTTKRYEHGIAELNFKDYLQVEEDSGLQVWLAIYQGDIGEILIQRVRDIYESSQCRKTRMLKGGRDEGPMVYFPLDRMVLIGEAAGGAVDIFSDAEALVEMADSGTLSPEMYSHWGIRRQKKRDGMASPFSDRLNPPVRM